MSWDVVLFNSKQQIKDLSELDEDQLETMDFNAVFEHSFTEINKDETYREIVGEGFSIDYYVSEPSSNIMLSLYGEKAIHVLIELAKRQGWQIYDSGIDSMIDLENPKNNGYKNHQEYVHQILKIK